MFAFPANEDKQPDGTKRKRISRRTVTLLERQPSQRTWMDESLDGETGQIDAQTVGSPKSFSSNGAAKESPIKGCWSRREGLASHGSEQSPDLESNRVESPSRSLFADWLRDVNGVVSVESDLASESSSLLSTRQRGEETMDERRTTTGNYADETRCNGRKGVHNCHRRKGSSGALMGFHTRAVRRVRSTIGPSCNGTLRAIQSKPVLPPVSHVKCKFMSVTKVADEHILYFTHFFLLHGRTRSSESKALLPCGVRSSSRVWVKGCCSPKFGIFRRIEREWKAVLASVLECKQRSAGRKGA